jgi:hypothetical protein
MQQVIPVTSFPRPMTALMRCNSPGSASRLLPLSNIRPSSFIDGCRRLSRFGAAPREKMRATQNATPLATGTAPLPTKRTTLATRHTTPRQGLAVGAAASAACSTSEAVLLGVEGPSERASSLLLLEKEGWAASEPVGVSTHTADCGAGGGPAGGEAMRSRVGCSGEMWTQQACGRRCDAAVGVRCGVEASGRSRGADGTIRARRTGC